MNTSDFRTYLSRFCMTILCLCIFTISATAQNYKNQVEVLNTEIRRQVKPLFDSRAAIAIDGPLGRDLSKWFNAEDRIMIILKEAYDPDMNEKDPYIFYNDRFYESPGSPHLAFNTIKDIGWSTDGNGGTTYRPIWLIVNMITGNGQITYADKTRLLQDPASFQTFINQTAIINAKKECNLRSVNTFADELSIHLDKYADILKKQIEVYNPTVVIICGDGIYKHSNVRKQQNGSFNILGENISNTDTFQYTTSKGKRFNYYLTPKRIYIEAYHPQAWSSSGWESISNSICEAVNQWKEQKQK